MKLNSCLEIYLDEISKTPLLTHAEEVSLARRIQSGDQSAHDHMVRANLRLVVKIAGDYSYIGMPLEDLVAEGNTGLMKAAERFDPDLGKFSTYAAFWIKQSIRRALANQSRTVRLPVHAGEKVALIRKASSRLEEEFGREPTLDEIAEATDLPREKISQLVEAAARPISLDATIGDDPDGACYSDLVADTSAESPDEALSFNEMINRLGELLDVLDGREKRIISSRFGLGFKRPKTLEEIGSELGVTRERIRQLQNIALKKMRRALHLLEEPPPVAIGGVGGGLN